MSDRDLLSELGRVLARLYHTAIDSLTSDDERAAMLTQLGLTVPHGSPPDAASARQTIDQLQAKAETDAEDTAELAELLALLASSSIALRALFEDVRAENDGTVAATMLAAYLELMSATTLRLQHPQGYAIFRALRLVDDQELFFERLPELLSAGGDILRGGAAVNEEEEVDARTVALGAFAFLGFFIPEPLDQSFVRKILFGIDLDPATDHPHAQEILNRMVTFHFERHTPEGVEGVEGGGAVNVTYALVPPHHGGPGLFQSLGGEGEIVVPLLHKQLALKIKPTLLGGIVHYAGSGAVASFTEIAGTGGAAPPDAGIEVSLERPQEATQSELPARLGGKDSFHAEVRDFKLAGKLGNRETGLLVTLDKAALVIPQRSFGKLLGAILPSSGVRLEASLTLGWNMERGFYIDGGAGLKATLPLNKSVLGLKAHTVTIELVAKIDEPAGLDILLYGALSLQIEKYFEVSVDRLGVGYGTRFPKDKSGTVMGNDLKVFGLAPTGIGVKFDLWGLRGGGFLLLDPDRGDYGGVLQFQFRSRFTFKAFGLLTEHKDDDGWSFVGVLSVEFDPPLTAGAFTLHGLGGIVAINHTINVDAMRAGLRDGALDKLLFPANPVGDAPAILQMLRTVFPVSDRRTLVGPMFKFGIGAPLEYLTASVALVVVTPSPYLIALLGTLRMALARPDHSEQAVVDLRADFFGVYDLGTGAASVDASLAKSRVAWYPIEGDIAYRSGKDWFLSAGGFHPHFPVPADAPQLRRVKLDVSSSALVRLRFEFYFALTSNTLQLGGRGELTISVGSFGVYGFLGLDALLNTDTLKFSIHVAVSLELRFQGSVLAALHADVLVEGPGPWHVKGRVSMSILFWDISVPFDETWAEFQAAVAAADIDVLRKVRESVSEQAAWASLLPTGTDALVTFRSVQRSALAVHPLGRLTIRQTVVPLGVAVTRVGTSRPAGGPAAVHIGTVGLTTGITASQAPSTGRFARAQYFDLTDDEKLSAPSYEPLQDGIELASDAIRSGLARRTDVEYETILVGAEAPKRPSKLDISHLRWAMTSGAVARSGLQDAVVNAGPDQSVRIAHAESVVVDTTTMQPASDVLASPATLSIAEQALAALASTDPARARRLQVVGAHEVAA